MEDAEYSVGEFGYCQEQGCQVGDHCVEGHEEEDLVGLVSVNIEVLDFLSQDSCKGVEDARVEKLEEANLDQEGGVHVGLGDVPLLGSHEDEEDRDNAVEDGEGER